MNEFIEAECIKLTLSWVSDSREYIMPMQSPGMRSNNKSTSSGNCTMSVHLEKHLKKN